jgi:hypothetical protein
MLKKIGLSTAALLAAMALVQAPSALAAGRDDYRTRSNNSSSYGSVDRDDVRYRSDYRAADRDDYRNVPQSRDSRANGRFEYNAPQWRGQQSRSFGDRDHDGDRR